MLLYIYTVSVGGGKTTAMIAGASVWGSCRRFDYTSETRTTKMNRGEIYHNLPMYMDELTNT